MSHYWIYGNFDFKVKTKSPATITKKLAKMIRESGFEEKNFEISVDKIKEEVKE